MIYKISLEAMSRYEILNMLSRVQFVETVDSLGLGS
jgi:hypothetical protein